MITLQQLLSSDTDLSGGGLGGKTADGGQDFLALLAGALTDAQVPGQDAPLTPADLRAVGEKLSKTALAKGDDQLDTKGIQDLLAGKTLLLNDDGSQQTALQGLVTGALPAAKMDVLKSLTQAAKEADSKSDLSEEELAGLSALMAMLPHQQSTTLPTQQPVEAEGISAPATPAAAAAGRQPALTTEAQHADARPTAKERDSSPGNSAPLTPVIAATAAKQEIESTPSPTLTPAPAAPVAPVLNTANAVQPTMVAAPVVSAPLGSHEWQQNVSQHITLFTKQGQQTAELRLHPEDLGQVQITLKLDDNQAQLQMVSPHSHVRAALEAALPVLRTNLAESGIQLSQSSVSSESFSGQQNASSQQQQQASRSGQQGAFNDDDAELLPTPVALQSAARGNSAVDIFA